MTAAPAPTDTDSYSTRTCRCGQTMQRLTAPGHAGWLCPTCGRRARR